MKSWQLVRHFLFFQIKVMKMDGGVLADIADTEPAHSADRMGACKPRTMQINKILSRPHAWYSTKIKLNVGGVYCVSYLSWKIGQFRTANDSPITPNEKPQNYTLLPILFDYFLEIFPQLPWQGLIANYPSMKAPVSSVAATIIKLLRVRSVSLETSSVSMTLLEFNFLLYKNQGWGGRL